MTPLLAINNLIPLKMSNFKVLLIMDLFFTSAKSRTLFKRRLAILGVCLHDFDKSSAVLISILQFKIEADLITISFKETISS